MEEILSSIRRIIAEEDGPPTTAGRFPVGASSRIPAPDPRPAQNDDEDDVLELTDPVEPSQAPARPAAAIQQRPAAPPPAGDHAKDTAPMPASDSLISSNAANSSAAALARLTRAVAPEERAGGSSAGRTTVDQLMIELLTPMLKTWLDENLPAIVERVVEQEVKKLARRAENL